MLTDDEARLLDLLLAGDDDVLAALRAQAPHLVVSTRMEDVAGKSIGFDLPEDVPRVTPAELHLGDVGIAIDGNDDAGFAALWVSDGAIAQLTVTSAEGDWKVGTRITGAWYSRFGEPEGDIGPAPIVRIEERDMDAIRSEIARKLGNGADEPSDASPPHPANTIAVPLLMPLGAVLARLPGNWIPGRDDLLRELPRLIGPDTAADWMNAPSADLPVPSLVRHWKAWSREAEPEPVMAALVAAVVAGTNGHTLLERRALPLARELFHYVRGLGIADWESAERHAREWWEKPESREYVWEHVAEALVLGRGDLEAIIEAHERHLPEFAKTQAVIEQLEAETRERMRVGAEGADRADEADEADEAGQGEFITKRMDALNAELEKARADLQRERREMEELRRQKRQAKAHADALEAEVRPLKAEVARLGREANALRNLLAERRATEDAGNPDPIPDLPEEGWPADLLAGHTIALCTGQIRAGARAAIADELRAVGAEVKVYELNGPGVPDRFAEGTLVVCDVRFTGHAATDRVRLAAERGGCELIEVRAGQGGIVRAVVKAVGR